MEKKKVAIVTGATRGIGFGIACALLEQGYFVVFSARSSREKALPMLADVSGDYEYVPCDISDQLQREGLFRSVLEKYHRVDVLVNNAGVAPLERMDVLETSMESYDRVMDVNLKGTFFMCQQAANIMLEKQRNMPDEYAPRIINISSISAYTASVNRAEYCISKAGIAMLTAVFADRLAQEGIPVFEIRPGIIATDMTVGVQDKYSKLVQGGLTPIRRIGKPQDVADMVLAACSGLLDFTAGQVLNADAGFHLRRL